MRKDDGLKSIQDVRSEESKQPGRLKSQAWINRIGPENFTTAPMILLDDKVAYWLGKRGRPAAVKVAQLDVLDVYGKSAEGSQVDGESVVNLEKHAGIELQLAPKDSDFIQCEISGTVDEKPFRVASAAPYQLEPGHRWARYESESYKRGIKVATESCIGKAAAAIEFIAQ